MDKVIDAASNTFGVRLELANAGHSIPGGIRCDINFLVDVVEPQPVTEVPMQVPGPLRASQVAVFN